MFVITNWDNIKEWDAYVQLVLGEIYANNLDHAPNSPSQTSNCDKIVDQNYPINVEAIGDGKCYCPCT